MCISAIVNESLIFTIVVLMSHIPYLLTHFAPHLINSKYIVNANYYAVYRIGVNGSVLSMEARSCD